MQEVQGLGVTGSSPSGVREQIFSLVGGGRAQVLLPTGSATVCRKIYGRAQCQKLNLFVSSDGNWALLYFRIEVKVIS